MNAHRPVATLSSWFALLVLASQVAPATAADLATDSPTATIATLQAALVEVARANPTLDERYRLLEPLIVATHNLPYIAEFALRRQWPSLNAADRQRYVAAFQRLSVMNYAARFGNVAPGAFRPIEAAVPDANGRVRITTGIARESQPDVSFEYLLQQDETGWRIINIVADGVSDLALKRAEYQRLFTSGGLEGLLAELDEQTKRLQE
ncbi:MAG TPA: ABC transporter substrate-binding protein [Gammaproteobacteria bacterium]